MRRLIHLQAIAAIIVLVAACGGERNPGTPPGPPPRMDAEVRDSSVSEDAGEDASRDSEVPDGSIPDGSLMDASVDAGEVDASIEPDADLMDASIDGGEMDATMDGGFGDGGVLDAGGDASPPMDASMDALDDWTIPVDDGGFTEGHRCYRLPPGTPCGPGGSCADGYRCVDSLCGDTRCLPAGRPCAIPEDCPMGSTCRTIGVPPDESRVCWRATGCGDSRDCPMGFSCEAGSCVDRRIPCQLPPESCPIGMVCVDQDFGTGAFCARVAHPCRETSLCPVAGSLCLTVTGSRFQCGLTGMCMRSSECGSRRTCGTDPDFYYAACMDHGPCARDTDCPVGLSCRDLAGDGNSECVSAGGTCTSDSDCAVHQVCATAVAGSAPACTTRVFGP